jgi:hypothetical protein
MDILAYLGAARVDIPRGFWVYALHEIDGTIFYVGQSGKEDSSTLIRRLADHLAVHKDRIAYVSVIPCRDKYQMIIREDFLIDMLQPAENTKGTADEERRREAARKRSGGQSGAWLLDRTKGTG